MQIVHMDYQGDEKFLTSLYWDYEEWMLYNISAQLNPANLEMCTLCHNLITVPGLIDV